MSNNRPRPRMILTPLDQLFGDKSVEASTADETPQQTARIYDLHPFPRHPFKLYSNEKMAQMVSSVQEYGIMQPLIVRERGLDEGFEIIAGHNRLEAARQAGLTEVPIVVRKLDDDEATLLMVESNFQQREQILPSEKAFAYKLQLDAIKRQAGRPANNSPQVAANYRADDELAKTSGVSGDTIQRYIRLTQLVPPLLDRVDTGKLAFIPAVILSYLQESEQMMVEAFLQSEGVNGLSAVQAGALKECSLQGRFDDEVLLDILKEKPAPMLKKIAVSNELRRLMPSDITPPAAEKLICDALTLYYRIMKR